MRLIPGGWIPSANRAALTAALLLLSAAVGAAYRLYASPFAPLIVAGAALGIGMLAFWVRTPELALYTALLATLLPIGLFPASLQSNLNRSLTVAALAVWGLAVVVRRRRITWNGANTLMLGFLVWSLVTLLWAHNLEVSKNVLGGYALRFVLFLFLIANEIDSRPALDGLMRTLAIAGWIFIAAGIYALVTRGYQIGSRMQVLEENENTLGALFPVLVVGVIWPAAGLPSARRGARTILAAAFMLLSFVLIALSGSRGGAVTWGITVLVLLAWRKTRAWGLVGVLILLAAAVAAPFVLATTLERFAAASGDTLLGGREALWQAAWLLIRDHLFTGVGVGNAPYAMLGYIRLYRSALGVDRAPIHNPILTILVETGLPGALLYLGVLASAIGSFLRQLLRSRRGSLEWQMPYFALTTAAALGYFASWIKGGGLELSFSYFLMLALLLLPANLTSTAQGGALPVPAVREG